MLKPVEFPEKTEPEYGSDSPRVVCECCGNTGPSHLMINAICFIGSPGHPAIAGFQCPAVEHWACDFDCWQKVMIACVTEHMRPVLEGKHKQRVLEEKQKRETEDA